MPAKRTQTGLQLQKLLKPKHAAEILAISERTLWTLTNDGDIPTVRIGHSVRYDPADLATWIEQQKTAPGRIDNSATG